MRNILLLLSGIMIISSCSKSSNEFCKAVSDFNNNTGNTTSLCFYKSTLGMLNFAGDSSYNKLISGVKKLKVITFTSDKETLNQTRMSALANQIRKESFVDMMQMKKDGFTILIFLQKHNEKPREFIGIGYNEKSFYIIDLVGTIPMSLLPSIISGNFNMPGLNSVLNFKGPDNFKKGNKHKDKDGDDSGNQ
jgi:hypothetical protein